MADKDEHGGSLLDTLETASRVWEIVTGFISAGSAILAFINGVGGPVQFLIEVAFIGFACYIALFVAVPVVLGILSALEKSMHRTTTDRAGAILLGAAVLTIGALIRFGLFAEGVTEDLDAIGTAFGVLVGIAILSVPFVVLWYLRGSTPNPR